MSICFGWALDPSLFNMRFSLFTVTVFLKYICYSKICKRKICSRELGYLLMMLQSSFSAGVPKVGPGGPVSLEN